MVRKGETGIVKQKRKKKKERKQQHQEPQYQNEKWDITTDSTDI